MPAPEPPAPDRPATRGDYAANLVNEIVGLVIDSLGAPFEPSEKQRRHYNHLPGKFADAIDGADVPKDCPFVRRERDGA